MFTNPSLDVSSPDYQLPHDIRIVCQNPKRHGLCESKINIKNIE